MRSIIRVLIAAIFVLFVSASCHPDGDRNSTDVANSGKEGAIDSTRITEFDTVHPPYDSNSSITH